jgi:hypothetical protein
MEADADLAVTPEFGAIEDDDLVRFALSQQEWEQAIVGTDETLTIAAKSNRSPIRPDSRVDDRQVNRAGGIIECRIAEHEGGLHYILGRDGMRYIDEAYFRVESQDDTFHRSNISVLRPEVSRERYYGRHRERSSKLDGNHS